MKPKLIFTFLLLCTMSMVAFAQFDKLNSYEECDVLARNYFRAGNIDSSISVFEYARMKFPDRDEDITSKLNYICINAKQDSKALKNWEYGLKKRYSFGLDDPDYDRFRKDPEFIRLAKIDKPIRDSINNLSHLKYEVVLPVNYSIDKVYPVLFVFHGNNWNNEISKRVWTSSLLKEKFITVYMESYIYQLYNTFQWKLNDEKTNREFRKIYGQIIRKYAINKERVVFTSMSSGGMIAIDYAFNQVVPVYGLVLNCPVVTDVSDNSISSFVSKDKKIAIITGENDWAVNYQKELISKVGKMGGKSKITINAGLGHEVSRDFSTLLDEYLNWMLE